MINLSRRLGISIAAQTRLDYKVHASRLDHQKRVVSVVICPARVFEYTFTV